ncbi:MAG: holo-[acyl-carrier-protein] synthase [Bacteroidota bacterium]
MIIGIGIDLVEVARIEKLILGTDGFLERVFSKDEIAYCEKKKNRFEGYAARFAAKEAFAKATGLGIFGGVPMNGIYVNNLSNGSPELHFTEQAKAALLHLGNIKIHLSMSHTSELATAMVVIEKL